MTRSFAHTMSRPHDAFAMSRPWRPSLPKGVAGWNVALMVASFVMALGYVVQVNASTSKGYVLRDQERAIERLRTETMVLESKAMQLASVDAITERAKAQGMEPVEEVRFVKADARGMAVR